jgi:hypothetical protein
MTELKLLTAALIATAMLAAPAMARESYVTSRHLAAGNANANNMHGERYIGGGDGFRGDYFGGGFGGTLGDGYGGRDVWGHWGTYYGPMVPTL